MSRPAKGTVTTRTLADATRAFHLQFYANDERQSVTLHERRGCGCGCGGKWTAAAARVELENITARVRAGVWAKPQLEPALKRARVPTLHEYASAWAVRWRGGEFSAPPRQSTIADYVQWRLPKLILPILGEVPVDDEHMTRRVCGAFKARLIADRDALANDLAAGARVTDRKGRPRRALSNASIKKACGLLGQILQRAVVDELLTANPARGEHMRITVPRPLRTFLEIDELSDLIDAAAGLDRRRSDLTDEIKALQQQGLTAVQIGARVGLAHTSVYYHLNKPPLAANVEARSFATALGFGGMRVSEALAFRERDAVLHGPQPRLLVRDAKTTSGVREVDASPVMSEELCVWRAVRQSAGVPTGPDTFVWAQRNGRARTKTWALKTLRAAAGLASRRRVARGLPPLPERVTPHTLRRTYISILLLATHGNLEYVMQQVGHADAETTMRIYSQLLKRHDGEPAGVAFDTLVAQARDAVPAPRAAARGAAIGRQRAGV